MRRLATVKILALMSVLVAACVTINVYFPAAAAEKAADRIIDDVWGPQGQPAPNSNDKTSLLVPDGMQHMLFVAVGAALDFVIPAAHAQVDLDVSTPEIRAITASMESRHAQLASTTARALLVSRGWPGRSARSERDSAAGAQRRPPARRG